MSSETAIQTQWIKGIQSHSVVAQGFKGRTIILENFPYFSNNNNHANHIPCER